MTEPVKPIEAMQTQRDPLFRSAVVEACVSTTIWLIASVWSLGVSYWLGYNQRVEDLKLVFGFPNWVFWGIVVPWITCTIVAIVFGMTIPDGELGLDRGEAERESVGG